MAVTHYDITANFADLLGVAYPTTGSSRSPVVAWLETNGGSTEGVVDGLNDLILLGPSRKTADSAGQIVWTDVVGSDSDPEDINLAEGTLQYRVTAEYVNASTRRRGERWSSGWFSLTADVNLADVVAEQYAPAEWQTAFIEQAQEYLEQQEEIAGLANSDEAQAYNIEHGTATPAALSASYVAVPGANIPRTLAKLRAGQAITIGAIGDSKLDPATSVNAGTSSVEMLIDELEDRFGVTITNANYAGSGHTAAVQYITGRVTSVVNAAPDLTIIEIGTNDSNYDQYGQWAAGYPLAQSLAAIERACAYIRDAKDDAEFLIILTTPYSAANAASNTARIVPYNTAMRALAASIGAELVDGYAAFAALGNWDYLLNDSTHRDATGNQFIADLMAEHFPLTGSPVAPALAARPTKGKYDISKVNKAKGNLGYITFASASSTSDGSYVLTGAGWTVDGIYDVTSTAGDSFTLTGTAARQLLANVDLGSATVGTSYPVVNIYRDGVLVGSNINLHNNSGSKNDANYWLPLSVGLDGTSHSVKLEHVSGLLRIASAAIVAGAPATFTPATETIHLGSGTTLTALPTDGSYLTTPLIDSQTSGIQLGLPSGWTAAKAVIEGYVVLRVQGQTTTKRTINPRVRHGSTASLASGITYWDCPAVATGENTYSGTLAFFTTIDSITGNIQYRLDARVTSTDKTNCYVAAWDVTATLVRTA